MHITNGGVLALANRVEVQRAQAAVLNTITESRQFDKIKVSKRVKESRKKYQCTRAAHNRSHADTVVGQTCQDNAQHTARSVWRATKLDISTEFAKVGRTG